ncbi:MAG TPA: hypothetical protein VFJ30_03735 [Phycisphaerae bacterium]|nr:hypothetical protein [Phycisphaerae bacterium]
MRSILWIVAAAAVAAMASGCGSLTGTAVAAVSPNPPAAPAAGHLADTAVNYTDDGADRAADSTVDRALMWSEKYAEAVDRLSRMQDAFRTLEGENKQFRAQVANLQAEQAQANKELSDANTLLVEMGAELERWKASVLGYREEMRQAQKAQLEALSKVIMLLGGTEESPAPALPAAPAASDSAKADGSTEKTGA